MLGLSGRLTGLRLPPQERGMEPQVNLRVTCRGETQSFLVSDSAHTTWADVEAMVKVSFDLDNIQIKYIDEDNDEVSVNSKEEYEEALKIAVKQRNQLQMNVYEENSSLKETSYSCSLQLHEKTVTEKLAPLKDEKKILSQCSMPAQGLEEVLKNEKELTIQQKLNHTRTGRANENPPGWFTSYLETFREQVVKETVEKLEQKLYEKLVHHNQPPDFSESSITAAPPTSETQSGNGNQCDWLISCCNCQARIVGVRYQCSLCPAYNICEQCEAGTYAHDPNHVLLKLRRPVLCIAENHSLAEFSPRLPATLEQVRLQKQMDKRFLKAEKQRLRAEKKQRKAEVRELKKQLKLHRKIHLWNSVHVLETSGSPTLKSESLQPNTFLSPSQPFQAVVPTLSAVFVDENLPDGTHLQPGTKFIKHWRMKNTGNVEWSSDTKLKLMWGNLTLASSEKKDVLVPSLPSGQVGTVSVEFVAPNIEGTYTSHWRLSHRGEQFGPRIWCSIVVDPSPATDYLESNWKDSDSCQKDKASSTKQDASLKTEAGAQLMGEIMEQAEIPLPTIPLKIKNLPSEREFYIPSVDLLTAQDLLSFELLDINIVQELERVPHNTPVDMTPCMSPLPHDSPLLEKPGLGQIEEENEGSGFKPVPGMAEACFPADTCVVKVKAEHPLNQEEGEEDMSGTQFVCETVIRSLTLDAAPDHKPPQKKKILQNSLQTSQDTFSCNVINEESPRIKTNSTSKKEAKIHQSEGMTENDCGDLPLSDERASPCSDTGNSDEEEDDVQSQGSSASSEDYIIILPECFDTSRPLGESMYSSALSQPSLEKTGEPETGAESPEGGSQPQIHSVSDILTTSQTLAVVPLTPEIADTLPQTQRNLASLQNHIFQEPNISASENLSSASHNQIREEPSGEDSHGPGSSGFLTSKQKCSEYPRYPQGGSIAGELVKGALSVAASAYKALFAGPPVIEQQPAATEEHTATLLSSLCEMGFCDRQLNLRLLKKHNNNMVQVVTELLQISNGDWYSSRC
ncbi:PREDICTED: next to BRCA1 gene 1 protein isoform X1 [Pygoscelis adeliae]|uniref:next to BRCA1 gene 1 protein isoform X1 n=1 Tax=Pygoscelis adeliae TaxID=9238 RepID=UPI0004F50ACB|nr:PREDICTED: next to BRCA1 gene 1 protein isoform X1 [Pygoscelis adeliae]